MQLGAKVTGPDGYILDEDGVASEEKVGYLLETSSSCAQADAEACGERVRFGRVGNAWNFLDACTSSDVGEQGGERGEIRGGGRRGWRRGGEGRGGGRDG